MGEEASSTPEYSAGYEDDDGDRRPSPTTMTMMMEWELGLPCSDDLTPLSQHLIPAQLASAFNIKPEPCRTSLDVNRASENTILSLRRLQSSFNSVPFAEFTSKIDKPINLLDEEEEEEDDVEDVDDEDVLDSKRARKGDNNYDNNYNNRNNNTEDDVAESAKKTTTTTSAVKRTRLVWTPQLHKRFVDVVGHLGIKNAVPKTIMQMMNVEGLTRENVASHLQKYRLYLKRMQGVSVTSEGPSSSDMMFAGTNVAQESRSGEGTTGIQVQYGAPGMMPMPMMGMGMMQQYGMMQHHQQQQREWQGYQHVVPREK